MLRRFFVHPEDVEARELRLRGDEAEHLRRVLRLGPGAEVQVFDGRGYEALAVVERLETDAVVCRILNHLDTPPGKAISIILGQGLPKAEKFAWIIQKATELGVAEIVPLITERAVPRLAPAQLAAKTGRWQKIAREACKQSARAIVPRIGAPMSLATFYATFLACDLKLVLWEREDRRSLRSLLAAPERVASAAVLVGPEGGLTAQEVEQGEAYGFLTAGLGPRILRTETAAMVAVSLVQYQWGDLGA